MTAIAAGDYATCGIGVNDTLYCWGDGTQGELGVVASDTMIENCSSIPGEAPCAHTPLPVDVTTFSVLAAGGQGFCGLGPAGTPSCWGDDLYDEIGTAVPNVCGTPPAPTGPCARTPVALPLSGIVQLSTGGAHSCAVDATGVAKCWGYGAYGRIGDGGDTNVATPTTVVDSLHFRMIAAGGASTCGILVDSTVACWGYNNLGVLGDGTADSSHPLPVRVSDSLHFAFVAVGQAHACGLTAQGAAYCWGGNIAGELGGSSAETCDIYSCATRPIAVLGAHFFTSLTLGSGFTCGVTADGSFCWGAVPGNTTHPTVPLSFGVLGLNGGEPFVTMSAGFDHACGITAEHEAYCWGTDYHGVLGHGVQDASGATPVVVVSREAGHSP